jgi:hypothetical protein
MRILSPYSENSEEEEDM